MGGRYYVCENQERVCLCRVRDRCIFAKDRRLGARGFDAYRGFALQALNQAIAAAKETSSLVHYSAPGSQYVSISYSQRLAGCGFRSSTGTKGDSYDNVLAENVNGSYKNELIHTRRWYDVVEVEIAIFEWVTWWNEARLHQALSSHTPLEIEHKFWANAPRP